MSFVVCVIVSSFEFTCWLHWLKCRYQLTRLVLICEYLYSFFALNPHRLIRIYTCNGNTINLMDSDENAFLIIESNGQTDLPNGIGRQVLMCAWDFIIVHPEKSKSSLILHYLCLLLSYSFLKELNLCFVLPIFLNRVDIIKNVCKLAILWLL